MPTYELTCTACGTRFERFVARMLRDDEKVCPSCGSAEVRQGVGGGFVTRQSPPAHSGGCAPRGGFG